MPTALITGGKGSLAQAVKTALEANHYQVYAPSRQELDLSNLQASAAYLQGLPAIDLLICNAGQTLDQAFLKSGWDTWQVPLKSQLNGHWQCIRTLLPKMSTLPKAHVIFIGSIAGLQGNSGQTSYSTAKSALQGLCVALAREYGPTNIRFNMVLPGFLETKMTSHLSPEIKQAYREKHCLQRFNQVEQVAQFIVFLDQVMLHTSGQTFNLDSRILPWS